MSKKNNSNSSFTNYKVDIHKDYSKIYADRKDRLNSFKTAFKDTVSKPGLTSSIFGIIVLFLFSIAFSHYVRTGIFFNFSFKSFIEYLSNMPDISLQFASLDVTAYGDWGIFTFLKSIWNGFAPIIEFIITIVGMIAQAFTVIYYLVSMFFI